MGSVLLALGGLAAVELSLVQNSRSTRAVNPLSVSLYALMVGLYAVASFAVRRVRQPTLPASERALGAGAEALVVGLAGAPLVVLAILLRSLAVGDLGR